jgi:hypothetical protein
MSHLSSMSSILYLSLFSMMSSSLLLMALIFLDKFRLICACVVNVATNLIVGRAHLGYLQIRYMSKKRLKNI